MKAEKNKTAKLQVFVKWIVLILLALVLVAYIFRQLFWT
jgi:hypothetical protein